MASQSTTRARRLLCKPTTIPLFSSMFVKARHAAPMCLYVRGQGPQPAHAGSHAAWRTSCVMCACVWGTSGRSRSCGRPRHSNIQSLNEFPIENVMLMGLTPPPNRPAHRSVHSLSRLPVVWCWPSIIESQPHKNSHAQVSVWRRGETMKRTERISHGVNVMVSTAVRVSLLTALALHSSAGMADAGAARHTGADVARRQAFDASAP